MGHFRRRGRRCHPVALGLYFCRAGTPAAGVRQYSLEESSEEGIGAKRGRPCYRPHRAFRADNVAAIELVARRARAASKVAAIYGGSPAHVRRYRALGYDFVNVSQDVALLAGAVRKALAESADA